MTGNELKNIVLGTLAKIAAETDDRDITAHVTFRDQLDFVSIDHLNFVIILGKKLGIEILENDYPKLSSING